MPSQTRSLHATIVVALSLPLEGMSVFPHTNGTMRLVVSLTVPAQRFAVSPCGIPNDVKPAAAGYL